MSWTVLPIPTSKARGRLLRVHPGGSPVQPSLRAGILPAPSQVSHDFGQVLTNSNDGEPLPLGGACFSTVSSTYKENIFPVVQAEGLKAVTHCGCCPLFPHLVLPRRVWFHHLCSCPSQSCRMLLDPIPLHASTQVLCPRSVMTSAASADQTPSDFSTSLLSWLEGIGYKIRCTHPNI